MGRKKRHGAMTGKKGHTLGVIRGNVGSTEGASSGNNAYVRTSLREPGCQSREDQKSRERNYERKDEKKIPDRGTEKIKL